MNKVFFHIIEGHTIDYNPRNDADMERIMKEILDDAIKVIILVTPDGKQVLIPKEKVKFYHIEPIEVGGKNEIRHT